MANARIARRFSRVFQAFVVLRRALAMQEAIKALDPRLNRNVAIKMLAPHLASHAVARQRFLREAQKQAAVSHDHVVAVHAIDEANRMPFLVMEYIVGVSLQQRLEKTGPL